MEDKPNIAQSDAIRIPWGAWELTLSGRGNWHHNPLLSWSAAEQRRMNEDSGFECPGFDGMIEGGR